MPWIYHFVAKTQRLADSTLNKKITDTRFFINALYSGAQQSGDTQDFHIWKQPGLVYGDRIGKDNFLNRGVSQSLNCGPAQDSMRRTGENPFDLFLFERMDCRHQGARSVNHVITDDDVFSAYLADYV